MKLNLRLINIKTTELAIVSLITCSLSLSGCSTADGYNVPIDLIPVTGTVQLDGTPLANATLNFIPANGTSGLGGYAITDDSGSFSVSHYSSSPGLEKGTYNVTFSKLTMPDGKPIPEGSDAADVGATQSLPGHLTEVWPQNHPFVVTVSADNAPVSFSLKTKRR